MTWETLGISKPRLATSVASKIWISLRANWLRTYCRWFWRLLPWMAPALTPRFSSSSEEPLDPVLGPPKHEHFIKFFSLSISWSISSLVVLPGTAMTSCMMVAFESCALTVTFTGLRTKSVRISQRHRIWSPKNNDWRSLGISDMKYLISLIKPISTIRSASSSTTLRNPESRMTRISIKSLSRPGVADDEMRIAAHVFLLPFTGAADEERAPHR